MIPNRDYGQPPPGGMVYTPEQTADFAAAAKAREMAAVLGRYASNREFAGRGEVEAPRSAAVARADARAALHLHPELLAILEGGGVE
jgi:hypothetical protein